MTFLKLIQDELPAASVAGLPVYSKEICGQKSSLSSCNSSKVIPILPDLGPVDRAEIYKLAFTFQVLVYNACQCVTKMKID